MQFRVQLIEVLRRARIGIGGARALDESIEFHECIGPERGGAEVVRRIRGGEFGREIGEIGEGEFSGVGVRDDTDVDY